MMKKMGVFFEKYVLYEKHFVTLRTNYPSIQNMGLKGEIEKSEQPRERLKRLGVSELKNEELLAIMIGSGIPGKNVIELAKEMLDSQMGSLRNLSGMTLKEMTDRFKGLGEVKAMHILAALELGRRHNFERRNPKKISSSQDIKDLLFLKTEDLQVEKFWCIFLRNNNTIIGYKELATGGLAGVAVDVRIILKEALLCSATGIVLVHNHPSGSNNPSREDRELTMKVDRCCATMDIRLVDHLILTSDDRIYYSFHESGEI